MKENAFDYLYVLDYSDSTICEIDLSNEDNIDNVEALLTKYGLDSGTCSWMVTDRKIDNIITLYPED